MTSRLSFLIVLGVVLSGCEFIGQTLVRTHPPSEGQPLPVFMLLGDDSGMRAETAANLVFSGKGDRVIFAKEIDDGFSKLGLIPSSSDLHNQYLLKLGLSHHQLTYLNQCVVSSTLEEARCLKNYLKEHPEVREIYLVTSWFHTSRAAWLFEKVFNDTHVMIHPVAAISEDSNPQSWWRHEATFLNIFNEYLKWGYWIGKSFVGET